MVEHLLDRYKLEPLYPEGGYYRRVISTPEYSHILYLLTSQSPSALHRLSSDEIWQFLQGDPIEQFVITTDQKPFITRLGFKDELSVRVPAGYWQGSRLAPGGSYALVGCTVIPPFSDGSYEHGYYDELSAVYPDLTEQLALYCRPPVMSRE
jgi:predicted cupin superfamily sugar epimerase